MTRRISWTVALVLALTALFAVMTPGAQAAGEPTIVGSWSHTADGTYTAFGTVPKVEDVGSSVSKIMFVRFVATFPTDATANEVTITLGDSLRWVDNGKKSIKPELLLSITEPPAGETVLGYTVDTVYVNESTTDKMGNGSVTYKFVDNADTVTITIQVKQNMTDNYPTQADAIVGTVNAKVAGEQKTAKAATSVDFTQYNGQTAGWAFKREAINDKPVNAGYAIGRVYNRRPGEAIVTPARAYEYVRVYVDAPIGAEAVSHVIVGPGPENLANLGWKAPVKVTTNPTGAPPIAANTQRWLYEIEKQLIWGLGVAPTWRFPSALFPVGTTINTKTAFMDVKYYGDDQVRRFTQGFNNQTYIIGDTEKVFLNVSFNNPAGATWGNLKFDTNWNDAAQLDAYGYLGRWIIGNRGAKDSTPKWVEFQFPSEKIGVTGVSILGEGGRVVPTTVQWKLEGDTDWNEKILPDFEFKAQGNEALKGQFVYNTTLGLPKDAEFKAFRYKIDNEDTSDAANPYRYGIRSGDYSEGRGFIYGHFKEVIAADETIVCPVSVYSAYTDNPATPTLNGSSVIASTKPMSSITVTTTEDKKLYNPGETVSFTTIIKGYNNRGALAYKFSKTPIIYFRDETGVGINMDSVTMVRNLSNNVDILKKYAAQVKVEESHQEVPDFNGDGKFAKVYKIDTTKLADLTDWNDKFAAAVGIFGPDANQTYQLTLKWTVSIPLDYDDGTKEHFNPHIVFVTDPVMKEADSSSAAFGDSAYDDLGFDVDKNGDTLAQKTMVGMANDSTFFQIKSRKDIVVSTQIAPMGGTFTNWDLDPEHAVKIKPSEKYQVKTTLLNKSTDVIDPEKPTLTQLFIPIPKKGQQWGQLNQGWAGGPDAHGAALTTFGFTSVIDGAIVSPNPDVYTIQYGTYTGTVAATTTGATVGAALKALAETEWQATPSASSNVVRILGKNIPAGDKAEFVMTLSSADPGNELHAINAYRAVYYEDLTSGGETFKLWDVSNPMAVQLIPDTVPVSATKEWKLGEKAYTPPLGKTLPKVAFQLFRKIEGGAEEVVGDPVVLDGTADADATTGIGEDPAWTYNFGEQPKTDYKQNLYTYFVREVATAEAPKPEHFTPDDVDDLLVTNQYKATGEYPINGEGDVSLNPTKNLTGRTLTDGAFTFQLKKGDELIEEVKNDADGKITFKNLPFTQDDIGEIYHYTITEVEPATPETGMTYDKMVLEFSITVADAGDGKLTLTVTPPDDVEFNNAYKATGEYPINGEDEASLNPTKNLTGRDLTDGAFTFQLKKGDELIEEVQNTADGKITFKNLPFTQVDIGKSYDYTITEVKPATPETGMSYDGMVLKFKIEVEDAGQGQLTLKVTKPDDVEFNNAYKATGEYPINGEGEGALNPTKKLTGRKLTDDAFTFVLMAGDVVLQEVKNKADGSIPFEPIAYTQDDVGEHDYVISEVVPDPVEKRMSYDTMKLTFTIVVADEGNGVLSATLKEKPADTEFNNDLASPPPSDYEPISVELDAHKTLKGRSLKGGEFTFVIKDGSGKVLETVTNQKDGKVDFKARRFSRTGSFVYTIEEVAGTSQSYHYDKTVYKAVVTVTAAGGKLTASVSYEKNGIPFDGTPTFVNTARTPATGDSMPQQMMLMLLGAVTLLGAYWLIRRRHQLTHKA